MHLPHHFLSDSIEAAVIIIVASIFIRVVGRLFKRLEHGKSAHSQRRITLYRLLTSVVRYVTDFVVVVMVLARFHVQTTSLIAGAGIFGLAISFGAQGFVQDVVTGMFLLYEDQFGVGDYVTFPALNLSGLVQEVGIRITRLTGSTGETVIIPNRLILEVKNHSRGTLSVTVPIPVDAGEDPKTVQRALEEAVDTAQSQVPGASLAGITAFTSGTISWSITAPATLSTQSHVDHWIRQCVVESFYRHSIRFAGTGKGLASNGTNTVSS
ncbi:small conductance mechanosensitive channel [Sulfobacillus thermosulfidooxidans DSM 9293]|uniref:Small conductance mechanosensitive channel n=1 Tax=Sulfobacillus thermosulfidooxidans (strain DSM 9293 / VKM B-1269 / AT-1) TaxID=929705 RepID=A0A1W1WB84_SULTA|nr:mechanosensitive ion channel domain-containing protein [Sulfobacillus thermosulfidooxidans]SMC03527.1 small conductance mechanosensitive channel [Sulfobacillus thermosulfidooxidans DSM 9293]